MTLYPVLILLLLGFILWMRDEMKKAPIIKDDKISRKRLNRQGNIDTKTRRTTMSETYDKIQAEIKIAMKEGNTLVRDTLRMVVADIKNKTVNEGKEITEEIVVSCLKKFAKQEEDSIASAKTANRNDLVEKATQELSIVSRFLPKMMPEVQMKALCETLYAGCPDKNLGVLMKMLPSNCDKKFCAKIFQGLLA